MATILARNEAIPAPFSLYHLPPMIPGSGGVAIPKADFVRMVCIAPADAHIGYNPGFGSELDIKAGEPHMAVSPDDHYPNQVMVRDCVVGNPAQGDDPKAAALVQFWESKGHDHASMRHAWLTWLGKFKVDARPPWWDQVHSQVLHRNTVVFEARKEQPVVVMGITDLRLQTSEGPAWLVHGSAVVCHPHDRNNVWRIEPHKFESSYDWQEVPSGLYVPSN